MRKISIFLFFIAVVAVAFWLGTKQSQLNKAPAEEALVAQNPPLISPIAECSAPASALVTKVIDGDTIVVEGGSHVRLIGMDADEKGYPCYDPARIRLERLILNKTVTLEKDQSDVDQYDRCLRYVFLDNQNIDVQMVQEGLAVARFYAPDFKYKTEISSAEKNAINNKIGCKFQAQ